MSKRITLKKEVLLEGLKFPESLDEVDVPGAGLN